ncbi:hypothetical protein [Campylobacter showae]|uniref:hypothetical protein n=1 Tax=Campylobacter showae TaxID=204 RepID=UPI0028D0DD42|nr:hypothetical protein [Campylobacter showae]
MVLNDLIDVSKKNGADEILNGINFSINEKSGVLLASDSKIYQEVGLAALYNELEELENDYFEVLEIAKELKC